MLEPAIVFGSGIQPVLPAYKSSPALFEDAQVRIRVVA
jgi:hypothetical protein